MNEQLANGGEAPKQPLHAWIVSADFLFVLLERVTILAAVYAVAVLTKSAPVYFVYYITLTALLFSTQAAVVRIASQEGLYKASGFAKLSGMIFVLLIAFAVAFGVPKIVVMVADSVGRTPPCAQVEGLRT